MAITDWPLNERPREKLLGKGAESLSDAELVAIFLRTGLKGKSAVDLAREVLSAFGSLSALCAADSARFCGIPGLGSAKYVQLQAVLEMARRSLREQLARSTVLGSPQVVRDYLRLKLQDRPHEVFVGVFLDAQNRVLAVEDTSTTGGSVLEAVKALREADAEVVAVAVVVDRDTGAKQAVEAEGLEYRYAVGISDLDI